MAMLPDDPEEWTDEEWLAWLEEGDAAERAAAAARPERPSLPTWRKGPVAAQFLAASMIAIGDAIYGPREEPAIIVQAPGEPPGDEGFDVQLDPEKPDESVILVRPWLLRHHEAHDGHDGPA
jgi:hypothetical protein